MQKKTLQYCSCCWFQGNYVWYFCWNKPNLKNVLHFYIYPVVRLMRHRIDRVFAFYRRVRNSNTICLNFSLFFVENIFFGTTNIKQLNINMKRAKKTIAWLLWCHVQNFEIAKWEKWVEHFKAERSAMWFEAGVRKHFDSCALSVWIFVFCWHNHKISQWTFIYAFFPHRTTAIGISASAFEFVAVTRCEMCIHPIPCNFRCNRKKLLIWLAVWIGMRFLM